MSTKWQAIFLVILVIVSLTITRLKNGSSAVEEISGQTAVIAESRNPSISYQRASLSSFEAVEQAPVRKWDVLDPKTGSEGVLIHSLDDDFPLYYENTHKEHVLASLTKLLTAVVVIEDIKIDKKIPITQKAVDTEGFAGDLKSGETYSARELLKIMLLTSSNDAAAAFEEYSGGKEAMVRAIHKKAAELNMNSVIVEDGSGLSDFNYGNAYDFLKLTKYIIKKHPEIFTWTQARDFLVQPLNESTSRKVYNINELIERRDFWGGKTGTSQAAGENLVSIFNIEGRRVAIILLGSRNRSKDAADLIDWVRAAYTFPK